MTCASSGCRARRGHARGPVGTTAQTRQRSLYVSVIDEAGAPVPDLGPADFVVREDNTAREVLRVVPAEEPMQIALLVDTSQGGARRHPRHAPGAAGLRHGADDPDAAGRKNEVAIIAFGERPPMFTEYSADRPQLKKGIDRIWRQQGSGSYLLDGDHRDTQGFKKREATRPVIVAIVDRGPELSYRQHDQVIDPLHQADAALYAIMFGPPIRRSATRPATATSCSTAGSRSTGGASNSCCPSGLSRRLKQLAASSPTSIASPTPARVADSAGKDHRQRQKTRPCRARHARQGSQVARHDRDRRAPSASLPPAGDLAHRRRRSSRDRRPSQPPAPGAAAAAPPPPQSAASAPASKSCR